MFLDGLIFNISRLISKTSAAALQPTGFETKHILFFSKRRVINLITVWYLKPYLFIQTQSLNARYITHLLLFSLQYELLVYDLGSREVCCLIFATL